MTQCAGITTKGKRCKGEAIGGSDWCGHHGGPTRFRQASALYMAVLRDDADDGTPEL